MVKNLLLLGSVAFGVSFSLSLLITRNIKTAGLTGLTTVPATISGIVVVNRKQRTQQKLPLNSLRNQIHQLKKRKAQLIQSLSSTITEKQKTDTNINFLKAELNQLYTQVAEQRSYKQHISQDLTTLKEQRNQLEAESQDLQTQVYSLQQRKGELHELLRSKKEQKQNVEASKTLPAEFKHFQGQIGQRQHQKEELDRDLTLLKTLKTQLEENLQNLQTQIQEVEKKKAELNQSLLAITATKQKTETNVESLQLELNQLQTQVLEQQNNKEKLRQEIISLQEQRQYLQADEKQIEKLPNEWNEFMMRLPKYELQVLKAVVEQNNTSAKIKNIAEENITMPELLIDMLNKRALNIIGDLIIEPGHGSSPPVITEDYLTNVKNVLKLKEIN